MNKLAKVISSSVLAALLVATSFPISASAATVKAGSFSLTTSTFKPVANFDGALVKYPIGAKPGYLTDTYGASKNRKPVMVSSGLGINFDLTAVAGKYGVAIQQTILPGCAETGAWEPWTMQLTNSKTKTNGIDVSGATDFLFWIDTTQYNDKDKKTGVQTGKKFIPTIQETDVFANGTLNTKKATAWEVNPKEQGGYFYYESNGGWVKKDALTKAKDEAHWIEIPVHYRGWIRIPFAAFGHAPWDGMVDTDGKFNGKQIQYVCVNQGDYANQAPSKILWDEFGFYGKFASTTTTTKTNTTTTTTKSGTTTTTATSGTSSAATASGASSAASSSSAVSSTASTSSDATSSDATASTDSTASAAASTSASSSSHVWIIVLIVVLVLAAAGVGGFFLFKKFKK